MLPPRHPLKPFSLAYFSLAKYGKTWYENKFGARMKNTNQYLEYREATKILQQPISIKFEEFQLNAQFTDEQAIHLSRYFDPTKSWNEYFNSIPKSLQCPALYGWLESFISELLHNRYTPNNWCIDIDAMDTIKMSVSTTAQNGYSGMRMRQTKTRRNNRNRICVFNHL
jgi:hypothetical protein